MAKKMTKTEQNRILEKAQKVITQLKVESEPISKERYRSVAACSSNGYQR